MNHFPALVISTAGRIDGVHTTAHADGLRIRTKRGLRVADLGDISHTAVSFEGRDVTLVCARSVEYGAPYAGIFGDAPVVVSVERGAGCGCGGPTRSSPTPHDLELLALWYAEELA